MFEVAKGDLQRLLTKMAFFGDHCISEVNNNFGFELRIKKTFHW